MNPTHNCLLCLSFSAFPYIVATLTFQPVFPGAHTSIETISIHSVLSILHRLVISTALPVTPVGLLEMS